MSEDSVTATSTGVADIRVAIRQRWPYVALRNPAGNEITRIDVRSDDRAEWTETTENPLEVTLTVQGKDDDIVPSDATGPTEVASTASHRQSSGGAVLAVDSDTSATIEADNDTAIITHRIYCPQD